MADIQVLSVTSEAYPLIKTGGLADVAGALPLALTEHGVSMRTLVPGYPAVTKRLAKTTNLRHYDEFYGGPASILAAEVAGLDVLVLDAPHLFDRPGGPYADPATGRDWPDNWRRFAALSKAGALIAQGVLEDYKPDLVHVHDWQAALCLAYLRFGQQPAPPSVITVHNIAFQGQYGLDIFAGLGLPYEALSIDGVEYYGGVGFLKAGLRAATAITTVSPTYAQEIRTPAFGMGLDGLINTRAADLYGIVNGIDPDVWNPATDTLLPATYTADTLAKRDGNRRAIEERFGLAAGLGPIFGVVSRLTWQKGMDILAAQLDGLVAAGARLAVLGSGDPALEGALQAGAARHPGRVGVVIGYDEALSHLIQGGTDVMLVPSRFEPCGLTQLYGLRYGCVPAVARTGGLADTVIDANEAALSAGVATGFQFAPDNPGEFLYGVRRIVEAFDDTATWIGIMRQGMKADVSWSRSAGRYASLYRSLLSSGVHK